MEDLFQLILKTYGIAGVLLLAPVVACVYLWRENKALHLLLLEKVSQEHGKVVAAQIERVQDAQGIATKMMGIISEQTGMHRDLVHSLERIEARVVEQRSLALPPGTQGGN